MNKNLILIGTVVGIAAVATGAWLVLSGPDRYQSITSYDECAAAGYPIMESYPEQCRTPDGRNFTRVIPEGGINSTTTPPGGETPGPSGETAAFGKPVTLRVGEKAVFPDGFALTVKEIDDSRCKPDVQCIWAGEISALFSVTFNGTSEEVRLGTTTKKSVTVKGHTITLQGGTAESVTVIVSAPAGAGGVSGNIHTGPTCPVERDPPDPACADRPYAGAAVVVKNKSTGAVAGEALSDKSGNFQIVLPTGAYTIQVSRPNNVPFPSCEEKDVTVTAGVFKSVDISCDSGIR